MEKFIGIGNTEVGRADLLAWIESSATEDTARSIIASCEVALDRIYPQVEPVYRITDLAVEELRRNTSRLRAIVKDYEAEIESGVRV